MNRANHKHALAFVFITVLIDMAGFAIIMPVLPKLIVELTGENLANAALWAGALMTSFAVMQFLFAPLIGNLSDRFGRRPVLLLSLAGFGVNYALMAFAPTLAWLFLGRLVAGIFGATFSTANAFIADISPPEKRAANFGLMGAAFGVGFIIGPVLGGLLGNEFGTRAPFFAASALALLNLCFGYFVLPETLPLQKRRPFEWRRANPFGAFAHLAARPVVLGLAMVMLIFGIAHQVYPSVWAFYTIEKFAWSERDIGLSLGAVGVVFGIGQIFLIRWAIPRFGEIKSAAFGLLVLGCAYLAYGLITAGWQMYLVILLSMFSSLAGPAINGIMSNRTAEDEQGELQGALASIAAIGAIIGPFLFTGLFGVFGKKDAAIYFPGAPFLGASVITIIALVVFLVVAAKMRRDHKIAE
ncbi:Uncharacterized MFS-type transporter [hydrothermal vent metagenome]|uniref:Uncharacterized MFS-type transporter n=1 Tax=hydrothermal vent metagenome TaxID=652676 RepID=A0A3B0R512_9ZZZZ